MATELYEALVEDGRVVEQRLLQSPEFKDALVSQIEGICEQMGEILRMNLQELEKRFENFDPDVYWVDGYQLSDHREQGGEKFREELEAPFDFVITSIPDDITGECHEIPLSRFMPRRALRVLHTVARRESIQQTVSMLRSLYTKSTTVDHEIRRLLALSERALVVVRNTGNESDSLCEEELALISFDYEFAVLLDLIVYSARLGKSIEEPKFPVVYAPSSPRETELSPELDDGVQLLELRVKRYAVLLMECFQ